MGNKCRSNIIDTIRGIVIDALAYLNFESGELTYYFDVNTVYFHELLSVVIIMFMFEFVLIRFIVLILKWGVC